MYQMTLQQTFLEISNMSIVCTSYHYIYMGLYVRVTVCPAVPW